MTSRKHRTQHDPLFGMPALRPEWEAQRDDAREREVEKTRALRAARLAAQAKPAEGESRRAAPTSSKKGLRVMPRAEQSSVSTSSE